MSLRLLAALSRLADAPGAEVVVFDAAADLSHPGIMLRSGSEARVSKHAPNWNVRASRRASGPPQHDSGSEQTQSRFHSRSEDPGRYLRVRDLDTNPGLRATGLDGVLLAGIESPTDLERLGARLAVAEAEAGIPDRTLHILPVIDTPRGVLSLPGFLPLPRLVGIACDPDRLAAALGCAGDAPAAAQARALTVLAAAACGVPALLVSRDMDTAAEREGFAGILLDDRR